MDRPSSNAPAHSIDGVRERNRARQNRKRLRQTLNREHGSAQKPQSRAEQPYQRRALLKCDLKVAAKIPSAKRERQRKHQHHQARKNIGMDCRPENRHARK